MNLRYTLKRVAESLPEPIGQPLSHVPFAVRLGPHYTFTKRSIAHEERLDTNAQERKLLERLKRIVWFAYKNVPFYKGKYDACDFHPTKFRSLEDWKKVPTITKADFQKTKLIDRSTKHPGAISLNTGGTSGQPLAFLVDRHAFAREWASMHHIWKARGYRTSDLKLTFRGKHFSRHSPLKYNPVHNEYIVNANWELDKVAAAIEGHRRARSIRWLHGYPSLIAEFASVLEERHSKVADLLREQLKGVLLGSEYPAPNYRNKIEAVLSSNTVSWYGHSEMAILARETAKSIYRSLPGYGYAEAIPDETGAHHLICTSYFNTAHPIIRYDTGDLIKPISEIGAQLEYRIHEGRVGDFIELSDGSKQALTAVIFGRHHTAFSKIQHLQIQQHKPGHITLIVTPLDKKQNLESLKTGFDLTGLDIEWDLFLVDEPIRTASGKIQLKLP